MTVAAQPNTTPTTKGWTFLTNHAHVLLAIVREPTAACAISPPPPASPSAPRRRSSPTSKPPDTYTANASDGAAVSPPPTTAPVPDTGTLEGNLITLTTSRWSTGLW